jgi:endonuclease YncB( thermonuclease family)
MTLPTESGSPTAYLAIAGQAVLVGKQPDGDSVRFRPADPTLLSRLENGGRVHPSTDGTVQLRFDGVDAPELHYQGHAQPQGDTARDSLLAQLGFTGIAYADNGATVTAATPSTVPLVILSRLVEVNGRPVSVVYSGEAALGLIAASGTRVELTAELLGRSINAWEVSTGVVYPLLYTSTAAQLRAVFVGLAASARQQQQGVWSADSSAGFALPDVAAVGPGGTLIFPKLFRRAVDYLRQRSSPAETLPAWLTAHADTEDDDVLVGSSAAQALHSLLRQSGDDITFVPDLLDLVFVER